MFLQAMKKVESNDLSLSEIMLDYFFLTFQSFLSKLWMGL